MNNKIEDMLYDLEYKVNELRKSRLSTIEYENMSVKDLLDLGFNNTYILINDAWYDLGYKWFASDKFGYEGDFGELNDKQKSCMVKFNSAEINDENYTIVYIELVNKDDEKYFKIEGDE